MTADQTRYRHLRHGFRICLTYTVKVRNKVLEVSEATIAKWNDIDGGEEDADL